MGKENIRLKVITVLMMLFACTTAYLVVLRYLPYVFQENVCFSRNGVALGDEEACRQASPRKGLLEAEMEIGLVVRTPWTKAKLFRELVDRCRQTCVKETECSFYLLRTYNKGDFHISYYPQISGICSTYQ